LNNENNNTNEKIEKTKFDLEDFEDNKRNELINIIQDIRISNNLTDEDALKLLEQIRDYDNDTIYDNFDFLDLQKILLEDNDHSQRDAMREDDIRNKKEWEEKLKEFEPVEITTFEVLGSEEEVKFNGIFQF